MGFLEGNPGQGDNSLIVNEKIQLKKRGRKWKYRTKDTWKKHEGEHDWIHVPAQALTEMGL